MGLSLLHAQVSSTLLTLYFPIPCPTHFRLTTKLSSAGISVLSTQTPFNFSDSTPPTSKYLSATYTSSSSSEVAIAGLSAALKSGAVVDIDVQADLTTAEKDWEAFEELLTKATADPETSAGTLIICAFMSSCFSMQLASAHIRPSIPHVSSSLPHLHHTHCDETYLILMPRCLFSRVATCPFIFFHLLNVPIRGPSILDSPSSEHTSTSARPQPPYRQTPLSHDLPLLSITDCHSIVVPESTPQVLASGVECADAAHGWRGREGEEGVEEED